MGFSSKIRLFYSSNEVSATTEEEDSSTSSSNDEAKMRSMEMMSEEKASNLFPTIDLSPNDFPLLHSLGINKSYQINTSFQELVKLKCKRKWGDRIPEGK
jgi:hypothetical protein